MANTLVIEERQERMVSPDGGHVRFRTAHFLVPSSIDGPAAPAPPVVNSSLPPKFTDLPLKVNYLGWKCPPKNWKPWLDHMLSLHHSTWTKSGIIDAITSSTSVIHRHNDLIFRLVEKWCPATNSFVFPWGEATITLEDVTVLGGFPVLGESVLLDRDGEFFEIVEKLQNARLKLNKGKAKKATQCKWMAVFMDSGSEIEHEAFLAFWLSRFVFPYSSDSIGSNVMSVAARLGRGNKLALAPAVLACIYKSLSLLKAAVTAARNRLGQDGVVEVTVPAPLAIVQVWVWERFPSLAPRNPRSAAPRLGRWDELKSGLGFDCSTMDSCGEEFRWRPYGRVEAEMEGWVRWLRVGEVVGLEEDCIEQYLPHRVARQFGLDQDIPGDVSCEVGWRNYSGRPMGDGEVYVPSSCYEGCVSSRYLEWWKEGVVLSGSGKSREQVEKEDLWPRGFSLKWKGGKGSRETRKCGGRERLDRNDNVGGEDNVCDLGSGSEGKNGSDESGDVMVWTDPPNSTSKNESGIGGDLGSGNEGKNDSDECGDAVEWGEPQNSNESGDRMVWTDPPNSTVKESMGGETGAEWDSVERRLNIIEKLVAFLEAAPP